MSLFEVISYETKRILKFQKSVCSMEMKLYHFEFEQGMSWFEVISYETKKNFEIPKKCLFYGNYTTSCSSNWTKLEIIDSKFKLLNFFINHIYNV
jgi:hypothetical protein